MTMDPSEKDALLYVPGAGLTLMEQMGMSDKTARFNRTDGTHLGVPFGGETGEHERVHPPGAVRQAAEAAGDQVQGPGSGRHFARSRFNILPMKVQVDYFPHHRRLAC